MSEPCESLKRLLWVPLVLLFPIFVVSVVSTYSMYVERQSLWEIEADAWKENLKLNVNVDVNVNANANLNRNVDANTNATNTSRKENELFVVNGLGIARLDEGDKSAVYYPHINDMLIVAVITTVMLIVRAILIKTIFERAADNILPTLKQKKGKWSAQTRQDKIDRFATCAFKFSYFVVITCVGWWVQSNNNFLPPSLGGPDTNNIENAFIHFPHHPARLTFKYYYLVQLSYHTHSLLLHLFSGSSRNDFVEMAVHHFCAIFLVQFSYFTNFIKIGSLVLFVHDIADIVGYAVKLSVDTSYTYLTLSIYVTLLVTWGYTRLYVFPFVILRAIMYEGKFIVEVSPHHHPIGYSCFEFMLVMLLFLHVYWYVLFIKMGAAFLTTGKTEDIQHKVGQEQDIIETTQPTESNKNK